jgi:hypothetical protein
MVGLVLALLGLPVLQRPLSARSRKSPLRRRTPLFILLFAIPETNFLRLLLPLA